MPRLSHWPARWNLNHGSIFYLTRPEDRHRFDGKKWFRLGHTEEEAFATWHSRKPEEAAPRTINAIIERYEAARLPNLAPATQRQYRSALKLLSSFFGAMAPEHLLPVHVYDFRERRPRVQGNREVAVLSTLMTYAVELGCVTRNLVREVRRSPEPPRDRYVEDAEVDAFLAHCSTFLKAYVRLKLLTGIRQGQMLDIQLSDWQGGRLRVKATKGGKDTYYTGEHLAAAVQECIAIRGGHQLRSVYLFATRKGQRYTGDGFRSIWSRAMKKYVDAGGERFTEHDLRAKVASDDPVHAQTRLQHRSSAMVKRVYNRKPAQVHVLHREPPEGDS